MVVSRHNLFPTNALLRILADLYALCLESLNLADGNNHYCSVGSPCAVASKTFKDVHNFRLVSSQWNQIFSTFRLLKQYRFFQRVEDVYYPHAWHINTKIRHSILFNRYRVFKTVDTENGDRGVFLAYDFGSREGCKEATISIVKAWVDSNDGECTTERRVYDALKMRSILGTPSLLASGYDDECEVYALVLEKLGPSLEDFLDMIPARRFDERMVLAVAIQMLDRYASLHSVGVIHNGVKPGNICLSASTQRSTELHLIDFGLSYFSDLETDTPLPSAHRADTVGNRQFLSILGHHGITQSQRDDLESLGYLLSFLYHGYLPWDPPVGKQDVKRSRTRVLSTSPVPQVWRVKMSTPGSVLFRDMDPSFLGFWKDVKSLAFGEKSDYAFLKSRFVECWTRRGFRGSPGEIDWLALFRDLQLIQQHRLRQTALMYRLSMSPTTIADPVSVVLAH